MFAAFGAAAAVTVGVIATRADKEPSGVAVPTVAPGHLTNVLDYLNIVGLAGNPAAVESPIEKYRDLIDYLTIVGSGGNPAAVESPIEKYRDLIDYLTIVGSGGNPAADQAAP